eukprot:TRINITY_DN868_c0_g2_i1.p2 TRINITY_DN868_c0_g2~~TRINITY_DN868_c0_g2_i1.p2  ORF type:complete len:121 (+),score=11.41 TRINITY_DN868_c0_g2_i1:161-523(+)
MSLSARLQAEEGCPDRCIFLPQQAGFKTFTIRNDGDIPWPESVELIRTRGDEFPESPDKVVHRGRVEPGQTVSFTINFRAPSQCDEFISNYRLRDPETCNYFGDRLWIHIKVPDPEELGQ